MVVFFPWVDLVSEPFLDVTGRFPVPGQPSQLAHR